MHSCQQRNDEISSEATRKRCTQTDKDGTLRHKEGKQQQRQQALHHKERNRYDDVYIFMKIQIKEMMIARKENNKDKAAGKTTKYKPGMSVLTEITMQHLSLNAMKQ